MLNINSNKLFYKGIFLLTGSLLSSSLYAADSAIRIKCKDAGTETKIYINNEYKGTCPNVDVFLNAGNVDIRARKVEGDYEQLFNRRIELIKGVPQRISVVLGAPQLTREAVARRAEEERKRKVAADKRLREKVQKDLTAARNGDGEAMERMVRYYTNGEGIAKNAAKAAYWQSKVTEFQVQQDLKAAKAGDESAMKLLVLRYETGDGVKQSQQQVDFWKNELEKIEAQKELRQARNGNTVAMNAMIHRYALGKGVEKDAEQARYWRKQVEAKKQQALKAQRRAEAKKEMDEIDYTYFSSKIDDVLGSGKDAADASAAMMVSPTVTAISVALDIISTPINITRQAMLSSEIAAHPSVWAKPDSMVAKAYLQQQSRPKAQDDNLFAAAK